MLKHFNKEISNLFINGELYNSYDYLGSFLYLDNGVVKTLFRLFAPNAKEINVVFLNSSNQIKHQMKQIDNSGFFELVLESDYSTTIYKYEIITNNNLVLLKSDPFARLTEYRPNNASIVYSPSEYKWNDSSWTSNLELPYNKPILIYEMHFGSWRKINGKSPTYLEMGEYLIPYLLEHNFTHVEFLPLYEHPLDMSWGYQGVGFYSITSRYGKGQELMSLIDQLHLAGIGVIFDAVLGHINKDAHGIYNFDGTHLYEYEDEVKRENYNWGTANLDFSKGYTKSFMQSCLNFYLEFYHVDGFRIDAVANLFYYQGNQFVGVNNESISFLKSLNKFLFQTKPNLLMCAEDSTTYPKVTEKIENGGVGFNYKWCLGFMNDSLKYFSKEPIFRKWHSNDLTFSMMYIYGENYILPYSHDEVVHVKGSLANKMPGTYDEKIENLRLMLVYYFTHPGKKLLFMGSELAQFSEWDYANELDWFVLDKPIHLQYNHFFKDLTKLYVSSDCLYTYERNPSGFKWNYMDTSDNQVYSYTRIGEKTTYLVVLNNNTIKHDNYKLGVYKNGTYNLIFDTNLIEYGGNNFILPPINAVKDNYQGKEYSITFPLTPLTALIFEIKESHEEQ